MVWNSWDTAALLGRSRAAERAVLWTLRRLQSQDRPFMPDRLVLLLLHFHIFRTFYQSKENPRPIRTFVSVLNGPESALNLRPRASPRALRTSLNPLKQIVSWNWILVSRRWSTGRELTDQPTWVTATIWAQPCAMPVKLATNVAAAVAAREFVKFVMESVAPSAAAANLWLFNRNLGMKRVQNDKKWLPR